MTARWTLPYIHLLPQAGSLISVDLGRARLVFHTLYRHYSPGLTHPPYDQLYGSAVFSLHLNERFGGREEVLMRRCHILHSTIRHHDLG
jgi:hypothetical protein